MSHRNARLTVHGRLLLVQRVAAGRPVSHVAREMGISRQCAHRWVSRYRLEGDAGLWDRSSRPHHQPARTVVSVEEQVVQLRQRERRGQDWLGQELGVAARTVSRILRRHQLPYLRDCDPITGDTMAAAITTLGAVHKFIRPHCPWQNGKVERLHRTLTTEWAYRQVFTSNDARTAALALGSTTTTIDDVTQHSGAAPGSLGSPPRGGPSVARSRGPL